MIEWNDIAKLVEENWELYDGFIILSGTDTLVSPPKTHNHTIHARPYQVKSFSPTPGPDGERSKLTPRHIHPQSFHSYLRI